MSIGVSLIIVFTFSAFFYVLGYCRGCERGMKKLNEYHDHAIKLVKNS